MRGGILNRLAAAAILPAAFAGCSSPPVVELDGLELLTAEEELAELPLGEYRIPIPVAEQRAADQPVHRNRLQLGFSLYALASPHEKAQIADAWARHEGKIRDQVIRVCRNATIDELQEPGFSTLKARLIDALVGPMGDIELQQLMITEVVSQEL